MALATTTISERPGRISPVNSELWYRLTSTFAGLPDFRYYAELYYAPASSIGSATKIGRYKFMPRPGSGDGLYSPHTVLKSYLKWSFNPTITAAGPINDMACFYYIAPGLGYTPNITYSGSTRGAVIPPSDYPNVKVPDGTELSGPGPYYYLRLICGVPTPVHNLLAGDEITISKDQKWKNSFIDGKTDVVSTPFTSQFDVRVLYVQNDNGTGSGIPPTYTESGMIVDCIRIQALDTLGRWAWYGARQWNQQPLDFNSIMVIPTVKSPGTWPAPTHIQLPLRGDSPLGYPYQSYLSQFNFKTDYKKIYSDQPETVNFLFLDPFPTTEVLVSLYDKDEVLLSSFDVSMTGLNTYSNYYFALQTGLSNLLGTQFNPASYPGTKYYTVAIKRVDSPPNLYYPSIAAKYEIVERDCIYENVRLCWLNKLGGYDYFNFSKETTKTITTDKKEWTKQLDYNYNFTTGPRQQNVYAMDSQETYSATSDWLTDTEYQMLEDLFTSPDVFVLEETPWIGGTAATIKKLPVIITDSSFKQKTQRREQVFNVTINYKLSHKQNIQSI